MIGIVDYGLGNVGAFLNVYRRMAIEAKPASTAQDLDGVTHVILPGVGAFDQAMSLLNGSGMRQPLEELVSSGGVPLLGVCVGMQILAEGSEEGSQAGLAWIKGHVRRFGSSPAGGDLPTPHMGWNDVNPEERQELFAGMGGDARFYFLHSYYFECSRAHAAAYATYGIDFACAVRDGSIFGVQFHPEKSHHWGAKLLRNFAEI